MDKVALTPKLLNRAAGKAGLKGHRIAQEIQKEMRGVLDNPKYQPSKFRKLLFGKDVSRGKRKDKAIIKHLGMVEKRLAPKWKEYDKRVQQNKKFRNIKSDVNNNSFNPSYYMKKVGDKITMNKQASILGATKNLTKNVKSLVKRQKELNELNKMTGTDKALSSVKKQTKAMRDLTAKAVGKGLIIPGAAAGTVLAGGALMKKKAATATIRKRQTAGTIGAIGGIGAGAGIGSAIGTAAGALLAKKNPAAGALIGTLTGSGVGAVAGGKAGARLLGGKKMKVQTKTAEEASYLDKIKGVNRAVRKSDKGFGKFRINPDLNKTMWEGYKKGLSEGVIKGTATGALIAGGLGIAARKRFPLEIASPILRLTGLGALTGAGIGALVGPEVRQYQARDRWLKNKGITQRYGGLSNNFSPAAKKEYIDKYKKSKVKTAKLRIGEVEDHLGYYFKDKNEPKIRKMIASQTNKRLGLKHPVATGIPTLGIWPAVSKGKAINEITRNLVRKDHAIQKAYLKSKRQRELLNAINSINLTTNQNI